MERLFIVLFEVLDLGVEELAVDLEGQDARGGAEELLLGLAQFLFVHLDGLLQETKTQEDLRPHEVVHRAVYLLFCGELLGLLEYFLKLHNQHTTTRQPIFTRHLFEHFINNHQSGFRPKTGREMEGLISHETSNRGLTNLLGNNDNIPIIELMRDILDWILFGFLGLDHHAHIFIEFYVDFG